MEDKKLKKGISLCMIVKNEERSLSRTLESAKELVDEIIIVDTGSTDNTIQIAKSYNAKVFNFKWIDDFSAARNESLVHANYEWILTLDADEYLDNSSLKQIRIAIKDNHHPTGFEFRVISDVGTQNPNESRVIRMFSNGYNISFKNKVHEQITHSMKVINAKILRINAKILHDGYNEKYVDQKIKQERNISLLKKMMEEEPHFYYWPYNLAISYMAIGKNDLAIKYLNESFNDDLHVNIKAAILNLLGGIYKTEDKWEKSFSYAKKSVELVKNQFLGHLLIIYYYNNQKDFDNELKYINKLLSFHDALVKNGSDLNNDMYMSLNNLKNLKAIAVYSLKDFKAAQQIFDNMLNEMRSLYYGKKLSIYENELYENILRSSVGCARDNNDAEKVIVLVKEYIDLFPEDFNGYSLLGEALTISKNYNEALKIYLKTDSLFPNNNEIQKKIATMFTLLGNEKKAEEWLYKMAGISDIP